MKPKIQEAIAFLKAKVEIIASHHTDPRRANDTRRRTDWSHLQKMDIGMAELVELEKEQLNTELKFAFSPNQQALIRKALMEKFGRTTLTGKETARM